MADTGFAGLGEAVSRRLLKVFWLVDASGSMNGTKMATVNRAIKDLIPEMREVSDENPEIEMEVNVIMFETNAKWIHRAVNIHDFTWTDISTGGYTATGAAIALAMEELTVEKMGKRAVPPLLILMSDGGATDDYDRQLNALLADKWGKRSVRIPIAIGDDCDEDSLENFRHPKEGPLLKADNAADLTKLIKWASVTVSSTLSQSGTGNNQLPPPPPVNQVQLGGADEDDQF